MAPAAFNGRHASNARAGVDMTRRAHVARNKLTKIRRPIREGFGLFRIAELLMTPVIRYCNDVGKAELTPTGSTTDYTKAQGHGVTTEPHLREALAADQVEAILGAGRS